jgi:hypothetical protein
MSEAQWQAESDARTLAEAETIKSDGARMAAAVRAAQRLADAENERARALRTVAKQKPRARAVSVRGKPMKIGRDM